MDIKLGGKMQNKEEIFNLQINELNLSIAASNILKDKGITTLGEITRIRVDKIEEVINHRPTVKKQIIDKLAEYNLTLKEPSTQELKIDFEAAGKQLVESLGISDSTCRILNEIQIFTTEQLFSKGKSFIEKLFYNNLIEKEYFISMFEKKENKETILSLSIDSLELSNRVTNMLHRSKNHLVRDIINFGLEGLSDYKNCGKNSKQEIIDKIHDLGLTFKDEELFNENKIIRQKNIEKEKIKEENNNMIDKIQELRSENNIIFSKIKKKERLLREYKFLLTENITLSNRESQLDNQIADIIEKLNNINNEEKLCLVNKEK